MHSPQYPFAIALNSALLLQSEWIARCLLTRLLFACAEQALLGPEEPNSTLGNAENGPMWWPSCS